MIIIISAPSGCGKSSISKELIKRDNNIVLSISATTRKQRPAELDGKDYFFKSEEQFFKLDLLESAKIYNHYYGTPKEHVLKQISYGKDILFDIDWQGAKQIIESVKLTKILSIFLLPPSMQELKNRLTLRNRDSEEEINQRLKEASAEMEHSKYYDHVIINDNFQQTVEQIHSLVIDYRRNY